MSFFYSMTRLMVTDAAEMPIHSYLSEGIKKNLLEVYICVMFIEYCCKLLWFKHGVIIDEFILT